MYRFERNTFRTRPFFLLLLVGALAALTPAFAQSGEAPPFARDLTVTVDCDAGETLTDALETRAMRLTVEFRGACTENLVLERGPVTLRGLDATATLTGAPVSAPAILVEGAAPVTFESFIIEGSLFGIAVQDSAGVVLEDMTVRDSSTAGLSLDGGSAARVVDSTFDRNGFFGISAFDNSSLDLDGAIQANGSIVGILASTGSGVQGSGATVVADGNFISGMWLQIGATAQVSRLIARNGLNLGLTLIGGGNHFAGNVELSGSTAGMILQEQDAFSGSGSITDVFFGILADEDSHLDLGGITSPALVDAALVDVEASGATVVLDNATVGDVELSFGSKLVTGANTAIGALTCDGTVLTRGPIACPAPLAPGSEEEGDGFAPAAPSLPTLEPFANPLVP